MKKQLCRIFAARNSHANSGYTVVVSLKLSKNVVLAECLIPEIAASPVEVSNVCKYVIET